MGELHERSMNDPSDTWVLQLYLVHTFVSYPKSRKAGGSINASITAPSTPSILESPPTEPILPKIPYQAPDNIPKFLVKKPLAEGAVVHCICVSL